VSAVTSLRERRITPRFPDNQPGLFNARAGRAADADHLCPFSISSADVGLSVAIRKG
jgi:hypothetical protein